MPTVIHFIGGQACTVEEDYNNLAVALHGPDPIPVTGRGVGGSRKRLTIYKTAVAYIEESEDVQPFVA